MSTVCGVSDIKTASDEELQQLLLQIGRNGETSESEMRRNEILAELTEREQARSSAEQTT